MALIEIQDVTKTFTARKAVTVANDGVCLSVEAGTVVGLFGHNGAGKTTIVNQLLGLLQPDSGSIVVAGEDVVANRNRGRYLCSVQPQARTPLGELTPRAVTRTMGRLRGASHRQVDDRMDQLFDRLDIARWADVPGNKLSGGVLRLTGFCMAAVQPGKAVVLDEPTNDVDPVRRRRLWGAIRDLTLDGTAVLLVTHSIGEAESAVDGVVILNEGRVVIQGDAKRVRAETVGNRMKLAAAMRPGVTHCRRPRWVSEWDVIDGRLRCAFDGAQAVEAIRWAKEQHQRGVIDDYSIREMTLEDTYIELLGRTEAGVDV
ncbi:MAG: multidrug ABC transporter ATP-binding protein [Micrococcales bacterium]|nr:MAG: multidrug ABC transporter ATP-binding protein [Micrococcales bacterium]PIE27328.1 MAG: multidrug ABC transporter ATP-binding protein [Micrococcales bacterium]